MSAAVAIASGAEPMLLPQSGVRASLRRIGALVVRYIYLLRSSGVRLVELIYWPFLQMLTWASSRNISPGPRALTHRAPGC